MSRSYKKHLIIKDHDGFSKNQANRKVRRTKDIPDGKAYRRVYESWKISDYVRHYDAYPRLYRNYRTGEFEWVDPDPVYKWRMK